MAYNDQSRMRLLFDVNGVQGNVCTSYVNCDITSPSNGTAVICHAHFFGRSASHSQFECRPSTPNRNRRRPIHSPRSTHLPRPDEITKQAQHRAEVQENLNSSRAGTSLVRQRGTVPFSSKLSQWPSVDASVAWLVGGRNHQRLAIGAASESERNFGEPCVARNRVRATSGCAGALRTASGYDRKDCEAAISCSCVHGRSPSPPVEHPRRVRTSHAQDQ